MSRVLLSGFRLRLGDDNFNPPSVNGLPYRLQFFDVGTTTPKEVYPSPSSGSFGSVVELDENGYVPVTGIWLGEGWYTVTVQVAIVPNPVDDLDWADVYTIPVIQGGVVDPTSSGDVIDLNSIAEVRALSGASKTGLVFTSGYYTSGDLIGGIWKWEVLSNESDDGGAYLKPTDQSELQNGRWHRVFPDIAEVPVAYWGVLPNQGDVSGNIDKAQLWCARTGDQTGTTLVFQSGLYQIGTADVTLDAVGTTLDGTSRAVTYHLQSGVEFAGSGHVFIDGPSIIDSDEYIHYRLRVANPIDGKVRPIWWGNDANESFVYMFNVVDLVPNYGWNSIYINREYTTNAYTGTDEPHYIFEKDGRLILSPSAVVTIGSITNLTGIDDTSDTILGGSLNALRYTGRFFDLGWTGVSTVSGFDAVNSACASGTIIRFTYDFTFDTDFTDINRVIAIEGCKISTTSTVVLGDVYVPQDGMLSIGTTGNIFLYNRDIIKASWFDTLVTSLSRILTITTINGQHIDFEHHRLTLSSPVSVNFTSNTGNIYIHNMNLLFLNDSLYLNISGSDIVYFKNCTIIGYYLNNTPFTISTGTVRFDNCELTDLNVIDNSSNSFYQTSYINNCRVELHSSSGKHIVNACRFDGYYARLLLYGDVSASLKNILVTYNNFESVHVENDFFIRLYSQSVNTIIKGCLIKGNTYYDTQPSVSSMMGNVTDGTSFPTYSWNNTFTFPSGGRHGLIIEDERSLNNPSSTVGDGFANYDFLIYETASTTAVLYIGNTTYAMPNQFRLVGVDSTFTYVESASVSIVGNSASSAFAVETASDTDGKVFIVYDGGGHNVWIKVIYRTLL